MNISSERHHFYISLLINGLLLLNCMLDWGAFTNVMTLEVMNTLGLHIIKSYRNVKATDSQKVHVSGVIKDLVVHLQEYPKRVLTMDVIMVDCPSKWEIFCPRSWQQIQVEPYI